MRVSIKGPSPKTYSKKTPKSGISRASYGRRERHTSAGTGTDTGQNGPGAERRRQVRGILLLFFRFVIVVWPSETGRDDSAAPFRALVLAIILAERSQTRWAGGTRRQRRRGGNSGSRLGDRAWQIGATATRTNTLQLSSFRPKCVSSLLKPAEACCA